MKNIKRLLVSAFLIYVVGGGDLIVEGLSLFNSTL